MTHSGLASIDIQLLIKNMGGSDRILPQLFELFWSSCDSCVNRLKQARAQNDLELWRRAAHELKGAALNITANTAAHICRSAENLEALTTKDSEKLLDDLEEEIASLRQEVAKLGW